jgi:endonuclease I
VFNFASRALLLAAAACLPLAATAQSVPIVAGAGTVESFDSLVNTNTSSSLPAGWFMLESGTNANGTYAADNGGVNSGNTYSYGATGASERALGGLLSGSLTPLFGARLSNQTGATLTALLVEYTGEQWRLGTAGREDRLDFQYSLDATDLASGTWTHVDALDFVAPTTAGAIGALDGNLGVNQRAISATIEGLSVAPGATLWVRWSDFNATSADDGLAIDNIRFAIPGDQPPTLLQSVPANGAANFPANGTLQLQFSEPVTLGTGWFSLVCSASGTRNEDDVATSGGPASYTLDPDVDFTAGESCTLTLLAAAISEIDGTPNPIAANVVITFSVGIPAVNQPPVVLATTPMAGSTSFPSAGDLVVLFDEPVVLAPGAFSLTCAASTGIMLNHATSGTSFSIDTGTALVAGDSCTFTVHAASVTDAAGLAMVADVVVAFSVASGSVGTYYGKVNTSSPAQLRCSLHQTIRGHTEYPYGWTQLEIADEDPLNPSRILDIYRNCSYAKGATGDRVGGSGSGATCGAVNNVKFNREHVWPRSLGFNNTSLAAHNDLHMLHLSDESFNAHRGNKPFDYCTKTSGCLEDRTVAYNGDGPGDGSYPGNSNWYTSIDGSNGSYEVWHRWRGNMARAIFYMAIRYEGGDSLPDLELTDNRSLIVITTSTAPKAWMGILTTLLEWHLQDPVDSRELERNEVVFGFQGNRNPFVDHPEWASQALFTSTPPATCELVSDPAPALIFANGFEN